MKRTSWFSVGRSNEALAIFVNAPRSGAASQRHTVSLLVHEQTHMISYYRHKVGARRYHALWLEETTAMMSEDIIVPALLAGFSNIESTRLGPYITSTGGGVSLTAWSRSALDSYRIGGSFGAFLNRRYGTGFLARLMDCSSASWACVDQLIQAFEGTGFADEFARFGASALGTLPAVGIPSGFGYPEVVSDGYMLPLLDASSYVLKMPATALGSTFLATSHTYERDVIGSGQTRYMRSGVVVPPGAWLVLVIR